jgi:hypothetical protein
MIRRVARFGGTGRCAADGAAADRDGLTEPAAAIDRLGGPDAFAVALANQQRTSTRGGILKADAVLRCAHGLIGLGVATTADLITASGGTRAAEANVCGCPLRPPCERRSRLDSASVMTAL